MRPLEPRLLAAAAEVPGPRHADIGTDHALLPLYLAQNHLCQTLIGVERSPHGVQVARTATRDYSETIEIRLGDGLQALSPGEVDSLSLCGLGGFKIVEILKAHPDRVPEVVIAQANRDSSEVRAWGLSSGYHLIKEQLVQGYWLYRILTFRRCQGADPAYRNLPLDLALRFGPQTLKAGQPALKASLVARWKHFSKLPGSEEKRLLKKALDYLQVSKTDTDSFDEGALD